MSDPKLNIQITAEDLATAVITGINTGFERMKADLQQLTPASSQAARSVDLIGEAYRSLGVVSTRELRAEQNKLIADFNRLKTSGTASAEDIARAHANLKVRLAELDQQAIKTGGAIGKSGVAMQEAGASGSSMFNVLGSIALRFNALAAAASMAWDAMKSVVEPALAIEKLETRLKSATGSAHDASIALAFVKDTSLKLGLDVEATADAFGKLAIATRNTSVEGKATRDMFEGFMTAFAALKMNGDETSRVFEQISQGFNKGKLELVDLKIIAEAGIPIFEMLAQAMGKSRPEIMKMISDGQLLANEVYPKVAEEAKKAFGAEAENAAKGAAGSIQNLKNELFLAKAALGEDLLPVVKFGTQLLTGFVAASSTLVDIVKIASMTFGAFAVSILDVGAAVANGSIFTPDGMKALKDRLIENASVVNKYWHDLATGGKSAYQATDSAAAEAARNEQRRQKEAADLLAANTEARKKYISTIANEEARLTEKAAQEYADKKKIVTDFFDTQLKAVTKGSADEIRLNTEKQAALAKLDRQRATDRAQIAVEVRETALKQAEAQIQAEIALIENKLAQQEISERDAAAKISALRKAQADEELKLAQQRVSVLMAAGLQGTDEYKKALDAQVKAQKEVNGLILAEVKRVEEAKKAAMQESLAAAENSYKADLNSLQESENNKTISVQEANLARIKLQRDYAEQVAALRAQELAQYDPQTQVKEYQQALAAKLDADKAYLSAKQAVQTAEAEQLKQTAQASLKSISDTTDAYQKYVQQIGDAMTGAMAASINKVKDLSDEAYNSLMTIWEAGDHNDQFTAQFRKTEEGIDAVTSALEEARTELGRLSAAVVVDVNAGAFTQWANSVQADAEKIRIAFLEQKKVALEYAEALKEPEKASVGLLNQIQSSLTGMNLLDKSTLDNLKGQIERVKEAMLAFTDQVRSALKSLQDEWDNMSMSKVELEEKRYREQQTAWQEEYRKAQLQQNSEAMTALQQQLELMEKIHKAKLADLNTDPANSARPSIPGMAVGGKVGGAGTGDTQLRWLDPREWVIRPEATSFWGDGLMAALNAPWTQAGQRLSSHLSNISLPSARYQAPRIAMAVGGLVGNMDQQQPAGQTVNITIHTTQPVDDTLIRRKIAPELRRLAALRA